MGEWYDSQKNSASDWREKLQVRIEADTPSDV